MRRLVHALLVTTLGVLPAFGATVDGVKIHSSSAGKGPQTIVLIHGWTCDSTSWSAQVAALSKKYRVVTLDLPGHGQSGMPADGKFSFDLFARAVEAVRSDTKADKIVLVGHSMGAPVIRQYARLYPQHVAGLVSVDGPLTIIGFGPGPGAQSGRELPRFPQVTGPDGLKARENMIRGMFTPETPVALQKQILEMMMKAPEATAGGAMAAMADPALWKDDIVTAPALAIYAGTARPPNADEVKKIVPNYEATQVAGTGHFVMMEKPEEFNRLLLAFLQKINF